MDFGPNVTTLSSAALAADRTLPLAEPIAELLGRPGLARGQVVACTGGASTSLAFALAARAVGEGAWLAVVDVPWLGVEAVAALGVPLERVVHIDTSLQRSPALHDRAGQAGAPAPSASAPVASPLEPQDARQGSLNTAASLQRSPALHDRAGQADAPAPSASAPVAPSARGRRWSEIVAATLDGFELVITRPPPAATNSAARKLRARLQQRGAVLVTIGRHDALAPDLELRASASAWEQAAAGAGHLAGRRVHVEASGRRLAHHRHAELLLPDPTGRVAPSMAIDLAARSAPPTEKPSTEAVAG